MRSSKLHCTDIFIHMHMYFCTLARFSLLVADLFSPSRLRGAQGGRVYSRGNFGSRPYSVARTLGVKVARVGKYHGIAYAPPSLAGQWKPHSLRLLLCCCSYHVCFTPGLELSSSLLGGCHGTTAVAHQARLLSCDGHGRCICVCACLYNVSCRRKK